MEVVEVWNEPPHPIGCSNATPIARKARSRKNVFLAGLRLSSPNNPKKGIPNRPAKSRFECLKSPAEWSGLLVVTVTAAVTVCVEVEPADPSELGLMWQATPISPGVSVVEEIPVPPIEGQ